MKLIDLDPMWLGADGRERMGVLFQCPKCRDGDGHYIAVYFENPIDGGPWIMYPGKPWAHLMIQPQKTAAVTVK